VTTYIARRLLLMVPALVGISLAVFLLLRFIPGDVVDVLVGAELTMSPEARATLRKLLGLDAPIHLQYLTWVWDLVRGDLGSSLRGGQPVLQLILLRLPITAELAVLSLALSVVLAIPLGVLSAVRRNGWLDFLARLLGLIGLSLPSFWFATMLIPVASLYFKWLPPVIFIGIVSAPTYARLARRTVLSVAARDYVEAARPLGAGDWTIIRRHILPNVLAPLIVRSSLSLSGAILAEA